ANRERLGCVEEILLEGPSKLGQGQLMGRTRSNRIVNVMGSKGLVGEVIGVRITGASANSLTGELLKIEQREVA
ncbi:MAG: TRAM domain-containing protein, partial [Deltaproteobacteria bacterium]|nr:TRAM domain-containing protein [Deltaproteobacteria bacterium]